MQRFPQIHNNCKEEDRAGVLSLHSRNELMSLTQLELDRHAGNRRLCYLFISLFISFDMGSHIFPAGLELWILLPLLHLWLMWSWRLNPGLSPWKASILPIELHIQPIAEDFLKRKLLELSQKQKWQKINSSEYSIRLGMMNPISTLKNKVVGSCFGHPTRS